MVDQPIAPPTAAALSRSTSRSGDAAVCSASDATPIRRTGPGTSETATTLQLSGLRPVLAYKLRMKSIIAVLTSGARSCSVQWPQPGSRIAGRSLGTNAACLAMAC